MKKQVVGFMLLLITVGFMSGVVHAQTSYGVKANVPFDFYVGDQAFRASAITVRRMSSFDGVLLISGADNGPRQIRLTNSLQSTSRSNEAKLVFHKYGNRYYLAQVWTDGSSGRELLKSRGERALQREMRLVAKNASEPKMVTIIAGMQ